MKNKKFIIIIAVSVVIIAAILIFTLLNRKPQESKEVNLVIWNIFDTKEEWQPLIDGYDKYLAENKNNPKITITFINKDYKSLEDYEKDFTNAIADGKGPDIFMLPNTWLPKNYQKIKPLPEKIMARDQFKDRFLAPVLEEQIKYNYNKEKNIYGIPLTVNTLMLIYNTQQLSRTGADPPETWEDFIKISEELTKREGNIITHAGTSLGTSNNVPHSSDILALLMMQNGTQMVSSNEDQAYFNRFEDRDGANYYPGTTALKLYTDFANKKKRAYSWNRNMPNSIESFLKGNTTMMFGYSEDLVEINKRNKKISYNTATVPQVKKGDKINYIYFWMYVVSKNCQNSEIAWDFLTYITSKQNSEALQKYYENKNNLVVSSVTDIVKMQEGAQYIGAMAKEANTAQNWYQGDALKMNKIFADMITSVNKGETSQAAIDAAAKKADQLFSSINKQK